jgi:tetratricopeptide (TPR) repeat protein/2-polyprenyl-3-methyl-5-hydroxy-6-metoxy-1,4-benzoquinol methylase
MNLKDRAIAINNDHRVAPQKHAIELIERGNTLEDQGRSTEAMACYEAAVKADPRFGRAHLNRGNALLATGRIDEARHAYEQAVSCDPTYAAAHFNLGNLRSRCGEYERALDCYRAAIDFKPDFASAFVAMGNALDSLGRKTEAMTSYELALAINPSDAGTLFNMGVLATSEGRYDQAAEFMRRAIETRPDYFEAHHALGKLLSSLGHLEAAEANLRRALSFAPDSEEILYDLAMILIVRDKSPEAVNLTVRKVRATSSWSVKVAFASSAARTNFSADDPKVRAALTAAINEPWAPPYQLCWPALDLVLLDQRIASCVRAANEQWPKHLPKAMLLGAEALAALSADSLLHALLEAAPVSTLEMERFLTAARRALLETASSQESPTASDVAALPFYVALTQQCFINEYIFDCGVSEQTEALNCRTKLLGLLDASESISPFLLLAVAAYFPLYTLPAPLRLFATNLPHDIDAVLRQQIREPLEEQALRSTVPRLTSVTHRVSQEVRDQYEQNPYPRWVKVPLNDASLGFNDKLRKILPFATFTPLGDDSQPEMLVAGCGTGSQSIRDAKRFRGTRVLAVDLSLSSLSYALRKSRELAITNIEYAQADILQLGALTRTFDIVTSVGVLHHLDDPFLGWQTLLSRVRPGGFMRLGFYSKVARRSVVKTREFIAARGYTSAPDEIRRFRRDISARETERELRWLSKVPDFYSTSECRDLVFHVQEHCLTLSEIATFLFQREARFLGFELDPQVLQRYRTQFPGDLAATNLSNWTRFEEDNPDTFIGMYQFWIQKPGTH